jgi:hypothetical protein
VAFLGELGDDLRADESRATDDYDLHDIYYLSGFRDELVLQSRREARGLKPLEVGSHNAEPLRRELTPASDHVTA